MSNEVHARAVNPGFARHDHRDIAQRILPFTPPWLIGGLLWPLALLAHAMWGTNQAALPWISCAFTLLTAGLTTLTAKLASGKAGKRAHAAGTVAAACAWFVAAVIVHPGEHPLIDLWLVVWLSMGISWNLRYAFKSEKDDSDSDNDLWKKVKLAGTRQRGEIEEGKNKVKVPFQLPPGELTTDDAVKAQPRLASALSVPANGVRITPDRDHADRATMTVVPKDMLRNPQPWEGPSHPGGSIADPIVVGVYEDAEPAQFHFPGDKSIQRNASHMAVMGMNGAGKSHGAKIAWTEILTRTDAVLWVCDPVKGRQTLRTVLPYLDWGATTQAESQAMVNCLPAVIQARADKLGDLGYDEWQPGCGLPFLVVWIEESPRLIRDSDEMVDAAQTARSAGVALVPSLQRGDNANMDVNVRAQLGTVWCFGVKAINDATFILSDGLVEAGADPSVWQNTKPGYSYLEAPGLDDERKTTPLRTFAIEEEALDAVIAAYEPYRAALDETTARAAGKAYAQRSRHDAARQDTPATGEGAASSGEPDEAAADEGEDAPVGPAGDPFRRHLSAAEDQAEPAWPEDPEPDLDGDADTELPGDVPDLAFPDRKPTAGEARRLLLDVLEQLHRAGRPTVSPRDVPKEFTEKVRSRPWVSNQLSLLAQRGVLIETNRTGIYQFPHVFPPEQEANAA